jgi:cyclohexanone monooxygenase
MTITDEPQKARSHSIDKEKLRQKYMEERNKRLRADGNDQYIEVKGQLAHYLNDP